MTIAEFFVKLGVKGADKTKKTFQDVDKGLGDIKSSSLAAKAAIVGMVYGLQRLSAGSAKTGTSLNNFRKTTGLSVEELQKWQYAGEQAGVSAESITSSVVGIQDAIARMRLGEGSPKVLKVLKQFAEDFKDTDLSDPFKMLEHAATVAQKADAGIGRNLLQSLNINQDLYGALRHNQLNRAARNRAPIFSEGEVKRLARVDALWKSLFHKFNMSTGRLNAKFGPEIVGQLNKVADAFLKITTQILIILDKTKALEKLANILDKAAKGLSDLGRDSSDYKTQDEMNDSSVPSKIGLTMEAMGRMWGESNSLQDFFKNLNRPTSDFLDMPKNIKPKNKDVEPSKKSNDKSSAIFNQNFNFKHDGTNAREVANDTKKEVANALYKMNNLGRVT